MAPPFPPVYASSSIRYLIVLRTRTDAVCRARGRGGPRPGRGASAMARFLRGTLVAYTQETLDLQHHTLRNGYLRVDLEEGQRLTILDEVCQLTEHLSLQAATPHPYVVSPLWATRPQYHPLEALPPAVSRYEQQVWWEQP